MDAGDVYGGGAPTGITFYENGALGEKWNGSLLSCDTALNTILGYRPKPTAGTFELNRFDFLTANPRKQYDGADFVGGGPKNSDIEKVAPSFFRPSDVTVGPDGAIYFCDWFDPRVGGSGHMDSSFSGTIYRVAPHGFKPVIPAIDITTLTGQIAALRSPAVNVRYLGFRGLRAAGEKALPAVMALLADQNPWIAARAVWLLPHLGEEGVQKCLSLLENKDSQQRVVAYRALRRAGHSMLPHARRLATDHSPQVRREIALSLRDLPATETAEIFVELARRCDTDDKNSLEAIGLGAANKESAIWKTLRQRLQPGPPSEWPDSFARLTWRLWGPASIDALRSRVLDRSLSLEKRKFAVESIAFIDDEKAARVMLELASPGSPLAGEATAWLMRNVAGEWSKYNLREALKEKNIYDPESLVISASPVPPPATPTPDANEILNLQGDPVRGKLVSAKCILCHKIEDLGTDYGPDLRGWARNQGTGAIIRAIADPSAEIALGYGGTEILLKNGGRIHGIAFNNSDLSRDDSPPVVIQSAGGQTQLIPRERIEKRQGFKRSLMYDPGTLGLTNQDIADLAAWLRTYQ